MRLRYADDFQALESYKMVEAGLHRQGITMQQISRSIPAIMGALGFTPVINAPPFLSISSPVVLEEYQALLQDHEQLIKVGRDYRKFDPRGKEAFLDHLAAIQN